MNQAKASLESLVSLDVPAAFPSFFAKRVKRDEKAEKNLQRQWRQNNNYSNLLMKRTQYAKPF